MANRKIGYDFIHHRGHRGLSKSTAWLAALSFSLSAAAGAAAQDSINPQTVKRVKDGTVCLRVTNGEGKVNHGSGFFAVEPGVIITNAHVVDMGGSKGKIEVVIHSGEADECTFEAEVLSVHRATDLAAVKLGKNPKSAKLPTPLPLGMKDLFETQKLYIFGFPFGPDLGTNITVSETSVSSLRKENSVLTRIQVNGGMHPGNSGGPVVNAQGEVVGVAVSGIRGTQIHFAVPAAKVHAFLEGGIADADAGELYRHDGGIRVPIRFMCLDPCQRIRGLRVETWPGKPEASRPASAVPQDGDGPRQPVTLKYEKSIAAADVALPKLLQGQVAWLQPVLILEKGERFGIPMSLDPTLAVDRLPADLNVKIDPTERTVHLKIVHSLLLVDDKEKAAHSYSAELEMLESLIADAKGARINMTFGPPTLSVNKSKTPPQVSQLVQSMPSSFIIDGTNKLRNRFDRNPTAKLDPALVEPMKNHLTTICNAYEAATIVLPNRRLQAGDTWQVKLPMLIRPGTKPEFADLSLTCTSEGVRTRAGNAEAAVSLAGALVGRGNLRNKLEARARGKFIFDSKRGFISSVKMIIASEVPIVGGMRTFLEFELIREEGNPHKLPVPAK